MVLNNKNKKMSRKKYIFFVCMYCIDYFVIYFNISHLSQQFTDAFQYKKTALQWQ